MSHGPLVRSEDIGTQQPVDTLLRPLRRFMRFEAAGGILLMLASIAALVWANSSYGQGYHQLWHETKLTFMVGSFEMAWSIGHWINDLLMAVFFLVVGMEIKRELLVGELASPRRAAVPIIAAIGGMAVPGAIFAAFTWGTPEVRGWGIPMATDIAFALGALAILGARVPFGLRIFLASLAIIDDLGALIVIAIFYTDNLQLGYLAAAGGVVAVLAGHNLLGVRRPHSYFLWGLLLWYLVYKSGVHATIAGVVLAATIPARTRVDGAGFIRGIRDLSDDFERAGDHDHDVVTNFQQQSVVKSMELYCERVQTPLQRLEHGLLPWVTFLIVPIFALANAGVVIGGSGAHTEPAAAETAASTAQAAASHGVVDMLTAPKSLGIIVGLVIGKPVGIFLATWLAVKLGIGALPRGVTWRHLLGAGFLGGIGFTMSLFIAALAFPDAEQLNIAKAAVLAGSVVAGVFGFAVLMMGKQGMQNDKGH
jgi:NhaA family Na+:H+ antiporter